MLKDDVEGFLASGIRPDQLTQLLARCMEDGSLEALLLARRLFEDDYGGMTFKLELKAPAGLCLLYWGEAGVQQIVKIFEAADAIANRSLSIEILADVAACECPILQSIPSYDRLWKTVEHKLGGLHELSEVARQALVRCILSLADDDDVSAVVGLVLIGKQFGKAKSAQELVRALSARWLALSTPILSEFRELIESKQNHEPSFQHFFEQHPQLLDPMAMQVWPQPNVFGSRIPDFVIRRSDNSYVIVEIECPGKLLVTKGGQLSSHVTHAEQQVVDYRTYMMRHLSELRSIFPSFSDPECLVVLGVQDKLKQDQQHVLSMANNSRHKLKIVGFDWLLQRASVISGNISRHGVEVITARIT